MSPVFSPPGIAFSLAKRGDDNTFATHFLARWNVTNRGFKVGILVNVRLVVSLKHQLAASAKGTRIQP
jgi:hypothetical protein